MLSHLNLKIGSALLGALACAISFLAHAETRSPLVQAVFDNNLQAARQLLDGGADPNALDPAGDRPLQSAVTLARMDLAKLLLAKGANPDLGNAAATLSPLTMSVSSGNMAMIEVLLDHGASIDLIPGKRWPPLFYAKKPEITRQLLDRGANVAITDDQGRTALHVAVISGQSDIAELLLKRGAPIDALNHLGQTALMLAVTFGKDDIAKRLAARGANPSLRDQTGKTALDIVKEKGLGQVAQAIEQAAAENAEKERLLAQKELEARVAAQPCRLQEEQWLMVSGQCVGHLAEGPGEAERIDKTRSFKGIFKQGRFVSGQFLKNGKLFYEGPWNNSSGGTGRGTCHDEFVEPCEFRDGKRIDAIYVERAARRDAEARERQAREELDRLQRRQEREAQRLADLDRAIRECQLKIPQATDENTEASCDSEGNLETYRHNRGNQARNAQLFNQFNRSMDEWARSAGHPAKSPTEFSAPGSRLDRPTVPRHLNDPSELQRQIQEARRRLEAIQQENRARPMQPASPPAPAASSAGRTAVTPAPPEWGASVPEAIVACWNNAQRTLWFCDGPLQETLVGDADINKVRDLAGCNPKEDSVHDMGVSGAYRIFGCGRGLRPNERDMRSHRHVAVGGNRYRCLKADMDRGKKCSQLSSD